MAEARQRAQLIGPGAHRIDLTFRYRTEPANNAVGADPHGRQTGIVTYYRRVNPARLVITGEPGAWKTLIAVDLLLGLLTSPHHTDAAPASGGVFVVRTGERVCRTTRFGGLSRLLLTSLSTP